MNMGIQKKALLSLNILLLVLFYICVVFVISGFSPLQALSTSSTSVERGDKSDLGTEGQTVTEDILSQEFLDKIQSEEYKPHYNNGSKPYWQLINRANNLNSRVNKEGWELTPWQKEGADWYWRYSLLSVSRDSGEHLSRQDPVTYEEDGLVYLNYGSVNEWYSNSAQGVEQGFTLYGSPSGSGKLIISGEIETDLMVVSASEEQITFSNSQQDVFKYHKLQVQDSTGRNFPAQIKFTEDKTKKVLQLIIHDDGAVYPLTVDPLSSSPDDTIELNYSEAHLGTNTRTAGDVNGDGYNDLIVGAPYYSNGETSEGAVFVFHGSATGFSSTPDWSWEMNSSYKNVGEAIGTAGDVNNDGYSDILVGVPYYSNGENGEGVVYLFYGSASGLSSTPGWSYESNLSGVMWGGYVSSVGDINGDGYNDIAGMAWTGKNLNGFVYVFYGSASGPSSTPDWESVGSIPTAAEVNSAGDFNGDNYNDLIIGAPNYSNGETKEGAAYVYYGSATGLASTPDWSVESNQDNSQMGATATSVGDINGDGYGDIGVGTPYYDNGEIDEGIVNIYYGSATPDTTADWSREGNVGEGYFGYSLATAGDPNGDGFADVIVGAPYYSNGQTNEGKAFLFNGSPSGLSVAASWSIESDQVSALLGDSVGSAGDIDGDGLNEIFVGASKYDNGQTDEGRVYIFYGTDDGIDSVASWSVESDTESYYLGSQVSDAGDVNGDGYSDVIVGVPYYTEGETSEGAAYVYYGSANGLSSTPDWMYTGNQEYAYVGQSIASAGDVNGDGYADVVLGVANYDNGEINEGKVFVFHGSASGLSASPNWSQEGQQEDAYYGEHVTSAGDVNGDGYSDLLVSAVGYDNGNFNEGKVFLYYGASVGLDSSPQWTGEGDADNSFYGERIASAGDVNGDGYDDVMIRMQDYDDGTTTEDRVFLYYGSFNGVSTTYDWMGDANQVNSHYGVGLAGANDVNNDGFDDVIIGAPYYSNGQTEEGVVFVYLGSNSGLSPTYDTLIESDQTGAYLGNDIDTAGDVNNDGYADILIASYRFNGGLSNEGAAFVYYGSASGIDSAADWSKEGDQAYAYFGQSVSTAGDANGDGYSDIIIGSPYYDNGQSNEGSAFLFNGNSASGGHLVNLPETVCIGENRLVHKEGATCATDSFFINLKAQVPKGNTTIRVVYEVKPISEALDGTNLTYGEWAQSGVTAEDVGEIVTSLNAATRYRWRARFQYQEDMTFSRWFSANGDGSTTVDVRTADVHPEIEFTTGNSSGVEDVGNDSLEISLNKNWNQTIEVNYSVTGGTATALGKDYVLASGVATVDIGNTSTNIDLSVVDDALDEPDETVVVTISTPVNATLGTTTSHTYTIVDNDAPPTVTLSVGNTQVVEDVGQVAVTANLSSASGREITVNLSYSGTAENSVDFNPDELAITIPAESYSGTIDLNIIDDSIDEEDETIVIDITTVINATENNTQQQTVILQDNDDPPTFSLAANPIAVEEGGTSTVTATLSTKTGKEVMINLQYTGTAALVADYSSLNESITIPAGELTGTNSINVNNDDLDEENETIIVSASSVVNAVEDGDQQAIITIEDLNDPPTVRFSTASGSGLETVTTVSLGVSVSDISGKDISVEYDVISSTATGSGVDYSLEDGTLVIPAGNTGGSVNLVIHDDDIYEADESIDIELSNANNAILGSQSTYTYIILNDDSESTSDTSTPTQNPTSTPTPTPTDSTEVTITLTPSPSPTKSPSNENKETKLIKRLIFTIVNDVGEPVPGVRVTVGGEEAVTNNKGEAIFTNFPEGEYEVVVNQGEVKGMQKVKVIANGEETKLEIKLSEPSNHLGIYIGGGIIVGVLLLIVGFVLWSRHRRGEN